MKLILPLLWVLSIPLVAIACGTGGYGDSSSETGGPTPAVSPGNRPAADAAPDFSIPVARMAGDGLAASTFTLSANRGKATVLYFSFVG